jgi:hypothetical protein
MFFNENINIGNLIIITVSVLIVGFWFLITSSTTTSSNEEDTNKKHVRFVDENTNIMSIIEETKKSIVKFIKNILFKTHVENGILKTTKYTSDSSYAEFFDK